MPLASPFSTVLLFTALSVAVAGASILAVALLAAMAGAVEILMTVAP